MRPRFVVAFLAFLLLCASSFGQQRGRVSRNAKSEQAIRDQLAAIAPQAVGAFQRATSAMDTEDYQTAVPLYQQVLQQAPLFTPAMRRLGASLSATGKTQEGLDYCQRAVQIERSPENLASLSQLLAYPTPSQHGSQSQMQTAFSLAKEAVDKYSGEDDASYLSLLARLALNTEHVADFRHASDILARKHPELIATHYFNAIRLAMDENWIGSQDEIRAAERLGMPREAAEAMLSSSGIHRRAIIARCWRYAPWVIGAWIVGLLLLYVLGKVLSSLTLRFIESADPNASVSRNEALLRACYRRLINVAGSFYYVSLPFVIVLVLGLSGGIIYAILMAGYIPVKLIAILGIGAIVTIYKMVQALFVRVDPSQPGRELRREEAPDFWNLTREVAGKLGTRPLDQIRVTPGTEMAVYEQGTRKERRNDKGTRTLLMGIGLLPSFNQDSFRAVLTHEYGHLCHRDTAGGDVALRVNQDIRNFAIAMIVSRQAVPWNVAFQFLRVYHFLFRRISYGATRLQEVLADRAAARLYGASAFEEGLRHIVRRQIEFHSIAMNEVKLFREGAAGFRNIYTLPNQPETSVEEAIDKALHRVTSEDDTHPSPVDRFRLVRNVRCDTSQPANKPMWDLFPNPESLTQEMTSQIENKVKTQLAPRNPAPVNA
jgi:Zn-dependent protease with chaperone function